MSLRTKIRAAAEATNKMDQLLDPALNELRTAIRGGNGAGVYFDVGRVRSALVQAADAIRQAQQIASTTAWPTNEDYDRCP